MDFTGERYVPTESGEIRFEHVHRYNICLEYVTGKEVLDIASGEGYGSALLATKAKKVTGVDIDAISIAHANDAYNTLPNLSFKVGACDAIPLEDDSVDVVVSFETIEHHTKHIEMMNEIKRVLRPDGLLIISSPNRTIYSEAHNYSNPYHVKELDFPELDELLKSYFSNIIYYGQESMGGSFIFEYKKPFSNFCTYFDAPDALVEAPKKTKEPTYFLAFCSNVNFQYSQPSIYINVENDLFIDLKHQEGYLRAILLNENNRYKEQIEKYKEHMEKYEAYIKEQADHHRKIITDLQKTVVETQAKVVETQAKHDALNGTNLALKGQVDTLQARLNEVTNNLNLNYSSLRALQNTTTVRFSTKINGLIKKIRQRNTH